jgi:hypothetical protein
VTEVWIGVEYPGRELIQGAHMVQIEEEEVEGLEMTMVEVGHRKPEGHSAECGCWVKDIDEGRMWVLLRGGPIPRLPAVPVPIRFRWNEDRSVLAVIVRGEIAARLCREVGGLVLRVPGRMEVVRGEFDSVGLFKLWMIFGGFETLEGEQ